MRCINLLNSKCCRPEISTQIFLLKLMKSQRNREPGITNSSATIHPRQYCLKNCFIKVCGREQDFVSQSIRYLVILHQTSFSEFNFLSLIKLGQHIAEVPKQEFGNGGGILQILSKCGHSLKLLGHFQLVLFDFV